MIKTGCWISTPRCQGGGQDMSYFTWRIQMPAA